MKGGPLKGASGIPRNVPGNLPGLPPGPPCGVLPRELAGDGPGVEMPVTAGVLRDEAGIIRCIRPSEMVSSKSAQEMGVRADK